MVPAKVAPYNGYLDDLGEEGDVKGDGHSEWVQWFGGKVGD
jgi:hypothetical protein